MINLLPPELKKQRHFAQLNSGIRQYVIIAVAVGILLSVTMLVGNLYTTMFIRDVEKQLADKQDELAKYVKMESKAKDINTQLKKFAQITEQTTRYSNVLEDLATNLPSGTKITGFAFDGKADSKLELTVIASNRSDALSVQPSLSKMDRFSFVDIQEFRKDGATYQVDLALAFTDDEAARR
jgi:Tfp pilus assembly protein PilN